MGDVKHKYPEWVALVNENKDDSTCGACPGLILTHTQLQVSIQTAERLNPTPNSSPHHLPSFRQTHISAERLSPHAAILGVLLLDQPTDRLRLLLLHQDLPSDSRLRLPTPSLAIAAEIEADRFIDTTKRAEPQRLVYPPHKETIP